MLLRYHVLFVIYIGSWRVEIAEIALRSRRGMDGSDGEKPGDPRLCVSAGKAIADHQSTSSAKNSEARSGENGTVAGKEPQSARVCGTIRTFDQKRVPGPDGSAGRGSSAKGYL